MAVHNPARELERERGRGWLPLCSLPGNCLLLSLDPALAWRLKEATAIDPLAPLTIVATVEEALRDYVAACARS